MQLDWSKWKVIFEKNKLVIIVGFALVLLLAICCYKFLNVSNTDDNSNANLSTNDDSTLINEQSTNSKTIATNNDNAKSVKNDKKGSFIFVDIKGAVQHPDIYKMKDTDRVKQLVDKAILLKDADLSSVNLAEKLQDQKVIYIPKIGDKDQKDINMNHFALKNNHTEDSKKGNSTINSEQININDATESQLLTINGIGPTKAKAIIEYRQQHGPFESVEQLKDVNGIGAKTLEKIGSKLTI